MQLETVKIVAENARGWKIINQADFDAKRQQLFGSIEDPKPVRRGRPKKDAD